MVKIANNTRIKASSGGYTADDLANAVVRTSTVDGAGDGVILATDKVIAATGTTEEANYWLTLPAPVVGKRLVFLPSVLAYVIKTNDVAVKLNGSPSASAVGAMTVGAAVAVEMVCTSATNWVIVKGTGALA